MWDIENLRNEQLISEREDYEKEFFIKEDMLKGKEVDFMVFQYVDFDFIVEDEFDRLRDECLIEERISYETYSIIPDSEIIEKDTLDLIIESFDEDEYFCSDYDDFDYDDFDFEYIDEFEFFEYQYLPDHNSMEAAYCGNTMMGYVTSDDPFDSLEGCDYPEGPNENIGGFRYPEPDYYEFLDDDLAFNLDFPEPDIAIEEYYDFSIDEFGFYEREIRIDDYYDCQIDITYQDSDQAYVQKLIEEHVKEENYINSLLELEVPDEYFLPSAGTDIIFL